MSLDGFTLPTGNDLISGGDDAITQNARRTLELITELRGRTITAPARANTNWDEKYLDRDTGHFTFSAAAATNMTGLPDGFEARNGSILVLGSANRVATQIYLPYAYYGASLLTRSVTNAAQPVAWSEWQPLNIADSGSNIDVFDLTTGLQHAIHRTRMLHAIGPIYTGGRAAVALRFDHGLRNFRDKVLPLTKAAGLKVSQAYNPRNWHYAENSGVTAADLNSWVAAGDVEIWNHSANHLGADTPEALYDQIVNGLSEIEAELPAAHGKVWGFAPPGVSSGNYGGFGNGSTPASWGTVAGKLIAQHHAVGSGYIPGTAHRVLDGNIRDGLSHITIDSRTPTEIKTEIDLAIRNRRGLQLMLHPSQLDLSGKLTTAGFREIIDYIVTQRDAGQLVTLSPYELVLADANSQPSPQVLTLYPGITLTHMGSYVQLDAQNVQPPTGHKAGESFAVVPKGLRPPERINRVFQAADSTPVSIFVFHEGGGGGIGSWTAEKFPNCSISWFV